MASTSSLSPRLRAAIALRVADLNGCPYRRKLQEVACRRAGIDDESVDGYRRGKAPSAREQAGLALATKIVSDRGHHCRLVIDAARSLGIPDAEIVEIVALVALNTFANCLACVARTLPELPGGEVVTAMADWLARPSEAAGEQGDDPQERTLSDDQRSAS